MLMPSVLKEAIRRYTNCLLIFTFCRKCSYSFSVELSEYHFVILHRAASHLFQPFVLGLSHARDVAQDNPVVHHGSQPHGVCRNHRIVPVVQELLYLFLQLLHACFLFAKCHTLNLTHGKLPLRAVLHPHPHGLRLASTDQQCAAYCSKQFVHFISSTAVNIKLDSRRLMSHLPFCFT